QSLRNPRLPFHGCASGCATMDFAGAVAGRAAGGDAESDMNKSRVSLRMAHRLNWIIALIALICLASLGCDYIEPAMNLPARALRRIGGQTPIKAARMMQDPDNADHRREGINRLVDYDFGKREPYLSRYRQMATM